MKAPAKTLLLLLGGLLVIYGVAVGVESHMSIINTKLSIKLDPSVQHIPLDPAKEQLRPPPVQIPASFDIFVGISVFRDGYRCGKTILTGLKRAKYPKRLYFGVVDQVDDGDERCMDEYCKMAEAEWPGKGSCPYNDHIRVDLRKASKSRGPTLARHQQQKLIRQEEFCLQLDGHSVFTNLWDENLLIELKRVNNEMAVLSTYLHNLHNFVKENGDNALTEAVPHLCSTTRGSHGVVRNVGASMIRGSKFPQLQALWGAGLSFSKCHAERRVPVDSHTLWMFDGEEFLRASRLWTNGYDFYSPSELGSVIYHNYSKVPARFEYIKYNTKAKKREVEMAVNRYKHLIGQPVKGMVDMQELEKFGFGSARSFDSYLEFSGVVLKKGSKDFGSCKQLHWVPYENATEIEELMGNKWKFEKNTKISWPSADEENGANIGDDEQAEGSKPFLSLELLTRRSVNFSFSESLWLVLFVVVIAFFIKLSKDSISRSIRRSARSFHTRNSIK
ncbi:hypothetical protein CCR75_002657 [Bremia lactucae]|uniref:Uncharacterized protein n=1 Tax=Bremia lactucae TaxID=4779 RepID=A0A976IJ39_BRELC|nr:hypothetical protein CCR75_002657 [Bremia lactucae]